MTTWPALFVSAAFVIGVGAGCGKDKDKAAGEGAAAKSGATGGTAAGGASPPATPPGVVPQRDGADGLKAWIDASRASCAAKDFAKGKEQTMSAIPAREQLREILKDDVAPDTMEKLMEFYRELPPSDEKAACLFTPGQGRTEVRVHASTVEALVAYKEGTPAFDEFPLGVKDVAETALRPGRTFYEVEVTEPGNDAGTKFHMFFWDGQQWRMLGPLWRAFKG